MQALVLWQYAGVAASCTWPIDKGKPGPKTHTYIISLLSTRTFAQIRDSEENTLAARLAYVDQFQLPNKGSAEFAAKTFFNEHELKYFETGLGELAELGWPMEYKQIQQMFNAESAIILLIGFPWGTNALPPLDIPVRQAKRTGRARHSYPCLQQNDSTTA